MVTDRYVESPFIVLATILFTQITLSFMVTDRYVESPFIVLATIPVSYTHLDVYKRQQLAGLL